MTRTHLTPGVYKVSINLISFSTLPFFTLLFSFPSIFPLSSFPTCLPFPFFPLPYPFHSLSLPFPFPSLFPHLIVFPNSLILFPLRRERRKATLFTPDWYLRYFSDYALCNCSQGGRLEGGNDAATKRIWISYFLSS